VDNLFHWTCCRWLATTALQLTASSFLKLFVNSDFDSANHLARSPSGLWLYILTSFGLTVTHWPCQCTASAQRLSAPARCVGSQDGLSCTSKTWEVLTPQNCYLGARAFCSLTLNFPVPGVSTAAGLQRSHINRRPSGHATG
jgi:hypothetical protein